MSSYEKQISEFLTTNKKLLFRGITISKQPAEKYQCYYYFAVTFHILAKSPPGSELFIHWNGWQWEEERIRCPKWDNQYGKWVSRGIAQLGDDPVNSLNGKNLDSWEITLQLAGKSKIYPFTYVSDPNLEAAFCLKTHEGVFWENNNEKNYIIQHLEGDGPDIDRYLSIE